MQLGLVLHRLATRSLIGVELVSVFEELYRKHTLPSLKLHVHYGQLTQKGSHFTYA